MRPMRLTSLLILTILAGTTCAHAEGRLSRKARLFFGYPAVPRAEEAQARESETILSWSVEGWGNTREDAWLQALDKARMRFPARLAELEFSLDWQPSRDEIKAFVKETVDLPPRDVDDPVGVVQGVRLQMGITAREWQLVLQKDRQARAESRMLIVAKMLAGFVAFLGAVAGYLRLEEMTKGYYTAWLRLAAIGFVTAVGAGIWWIS